MAFSTYESASNYASKSALTSGDKITFSDNNILGFSTASATGLLLFLASNAAYATLASYSSYATTAN